MIDYICAQYLFFAYRFYQMKRLLLIVFTYLCYTQLLLAQCEQEVFVYMYNGEKAKSPLAGVEVIVQNCGSTVTDKNGQCTLRFRSLKPGDKVTLRRADKPGYVVFNTEAIEQWHISRDGSAFTIVLAKQKDMVKQREMYTRAVTKDLDRQRQLEEGVIGKQLSSGKITKTEYERKLASLQAEYESRLEDIDNYIERIVHADLSEMDKTEKEVLDLVKKGDILGAIKAYEEMDIMGLYNQSKNEIATLEADIEKMEQAKEKSNEARKLLYAQAKRQNALLWMAGGEENIERGFQLLREVAMADTTEVTPLLEYGKYCMRSHRIDEAEEALGYVLRNSKDTASTLMANVYLCNLETMQRNYGDPINKLIEIDNFCKERQEQTGNKYLYNEERAEALSLLVKSLIAVRDSIKAFRYSTPLMNSARLNYEASGSDESKRLFVEGLYSAHRVLHSFGRREADKTDAKILLAEAIELQEGLYHNDPVRQGAMLAYLHSTLANHYRVKFKDKERASEEYETAENLYLEAYRKNPKAYAVYLANQNLNHALLFLNKEDLKTNPERVKALLDEAKKYQDLAIIYDPYHNKQNIASLESMFFTYYFLTGDVEIALVHLNKAIDIAHSLFEGNPSLYVRYYVEMLADARKHLKKYSDLFEKEYSDIEFRLYELYKWTKEQGKTLKELDDAIKD